MAADLMWEEQACSRVAISVANFRPVGQCLGVLVVVGLHVELLFVWCSFIVKRLVISILEPPGGWYTVDNMPRKISKSFWIELHWKLFGEMCL